MDLTVAVHRRWYKKTSQRYQRRNDVFRGLRLANRGAESRAGIGTVGILALRVCGVQENRTHYKQQIPELLWFNALLIASNGADPDKTIRTLANTR